MHEHKLSSIFSFASLVALFGIGNSFCMRFSFFNKRYKNYVRMYLISYQCVPLNVTVKNGNHFLIETQDKKISLLQLMFSITFIILLSH